MNFNEDIEACVQVLQSGGLILYPTDTVWGIGCDATNKNAVTRIFQLKNRSDEKAMIVLVADERDVLKYVAAPDLALFDYLQKIKNPTSVIFDGAIGLAENLTGKDGSIAMRICREPFCRHLIKRFRKPVVSTSANISGQPVARTYPEISNEIKNGVDYVVKHRQGDLTITKPSSVIRWNNGKVDVLRP
jgi:L-threonylcarbamoyladenylate synthase